MLYRMYIRIKMTKFSFIELINIINYFRQSNPLGFLKVKNRSLACKL